MLTSKEIKKIKTEANTYNHQEKKSTKTGGRYGHKGETLTKEKLITKIKDNNILEKSDTLYKRYIKTKRYRKV